MFFKFSKFHRFLNQYQACLYLFECIFHGDSKYSHQILERWHFLTFFDFFDCRLLTPAAGKGLGFLCSPQDVGFVWNVSVKVSVEGRTQIHNLEVHLGVLLKKSYHRTFIYLRILIESKLLKRFLRKVTASTKSGYMFQLH